MLKKKVKKKPSKIGLNVWCCRFVSDKYTIKNRLKKGCISYFTFYSDTTLYGEGVANIEVGLDMEGKIQTRR